MIHQPSAGAPNSQGKMHRLPLIFKVRLCSDAYGYGCSRRVVRVIDLQQEMAERASISSHGHSMCI